MAKVAIGALLHELNLLFSEPPRGTGPRIPIDPKDQDKVYQLVKDRYSAYDWPTDTPQSEMAGKMRSKSLFIKREQKRLKYLRKECFKKRLAEVRLPEDKVDHLRVAIASYLDALKRFTSTSQRTTKDDPLLEFFTDKESYEKFEKAFATLNAKHKWLRRAETRCAALPALAVFDFCDDKLKILNGNASANQFVMRLVRDFTGEAIGSSTVTKYKKQGYLSEVKKFVTEISEAYYKHTKAKVKKK